MNLAHHTPNLTPKLPRAVEAWIDAGMPEDSAMTSAVRRLFAALKARRLAEALPAERLASLAELAEALLAIEGLEMQGLEERLANLEAKLLATGPTNN